MVNENKMHGIIKASVRKVLMEKHRPSGTSRRIHTRDANGKKQSFDYIPNLPKYNKNLDFKKASKFQRINARQVDDPNGEDIDTVLKDGTIERKGLHLPQGYYNVNNVGGSEHWGIDPKTFAKKYELDPEMDGVYKPKGGSMNASQPLKRNVAFQAPWGGRMDMKKGSRIMQDPNNAKDTYGIGGDEFDSTYKFEECVKRNTSKVINEIAKKKQLTESNFNRIVKESVNKVLNEMGPGQANLLGRAYARRKRMGDDATANEIEQYYQRRVQPKLYQKSVLDDDPFDQGMKRQNAFMHDIDKYNYFSNYGSDAGNKKAADEYEHLQDYNGIFASDYSKWRNTPTHKQTERPKRINGYRLDNI